MERAAVSPPARWMKHSFRLPDSLQDGDYPLVISDSDYRQMTEASRNPGGERVDDYDSLVALLKRNFPRNKIYVTLMDKDTGVSVRGAEMPKLPDSVITTLETTTEPRFYAPVRGNFIVDADLVTAYDLSGGANLTVMVQRKQN